MDVIQYIYGQHEHSVPAASTDWTQRAVIKQSEL